MTKEEILKDFKEMLSQLFDLDPDQIKPESKLFDDLDLDSIDAVDLAVKLQKKTGRKILPQDFKEVRTVQDVVDIIYKLVNGGK